MLVTYLCYDSYRKTILFYFMFTSKNLIVGREGLIISKLFIDVISGSLGSK